jgi:DNA-binding beta-propeller fold protein YncE
VTAWGAFGDGSGKFVGPAGVSVDGAGNVYVADSNNNRIQKFAASSVVRAAGTPSALRVGSSARP